MIWELDHEQLFFDQGLHMPSRTLYLEGEDVDHDTASKFIKGLHILERLSTEPILLYISSPGGGVSEGLAIHDAIKGARSLVTAYCLGDASSMASIILQACDHRVCSPNTELTLHDISIGIDGKSEDVHKRAESTKRQCERFYEIYAERSTQDKSYFRRKLKSEFILSAQMALDLGLVDEIK